MHYGKLIQNHIKSIVHCGTDPISYFGFTLKSGKLATFHDRPEEYQHIMCHSHPHSNKILTIKVYVHKVEFCHLSCSLKNLQICDDLQHVFFFHVLPYY